MKLKPWLYLAAGVVVLGLGVVLAYRVAVQRLQSGIQEALGPRSSVESIDVGWHAVVLHHLRIRSAKGWPAEDELRAAQVTVVPDLGSLLGGAWRVHSVTVDEAYVSILRTRAGTLKVLPALLERAADRGPQSPPASSTPASSAAGAGPQVRIGTVVLNNAAIDFFDASVRRPAHHMRIEQLQAELGPLVLPQLDAPLRLDLSGVFKGPRRDGQIRIAGTFTPATLDAHLKASVAHADLIALQPYILKFNEGGVRQGTLDLEIDATVRHRRLHAPGEVTLTDLELSSGKGTMSTFAGVPRQLVIAAMSRDHRIQVDFTLDGSLDDPRFSLNAAFAQRMAVGLAEQLGVSVKGVVEGMGNVIKGLFGH